MNFPELSIPIRTAIISSPSITELLEPYKGSYPVFTRSPVPTDAPDLCVVISPNTSVIHSDGISHQRLIVSRDIAVIAQNNTKNWRSIDKIARSIIRHFHRKPRNLIVEGWNTVSITAIIGGGSGDGLYQTISVTARLMIELAAK